jgi:hypothetical protein
MLRIGLVSAVLGTVSAAMLGCTPAGDVGTPTEGTGGRAATGSGGSTTTTGSGGSSTTTGSGGSTTTTGSGGSTTTGSGGSTTAGSGGTTAGSGGRGGAGGTAAGSGGRAGTGGATGTGGAAGSRGSGGATAGTGGTTGAVVSPTCRIPAWPSPTGSMVMISGTRDVSGTYDGGGALHEGNLTDCAGSSAQDSTEPMFDVADGGTIRNVIMGRRVGDGIHCQGSCTIENVWFANVCDDAITMLGGSGETMTIRNSGFKNARDKTIQHNGEGSTVVIDNVYIETAGKLYRSCGDGCSATARRNVTVMNVVAIGVDQVIGVSTNDRATLSNICAYRTGGLCKAYQPGSETESTIGANGTSEGPSAACTYTGAQSHALIDRVPAGRLATEVLCTGSNSAKDGMTNNTACVTGFETCVKGCAPGLYGFKQINCVSGRYAASGTGCVMASDATVAARLAGTNATNVTATATNNETCTSQWAWARDTDGSGQYCVCVPKPGYYQESNTSWFVWDCQTQWW